MIARLLAWRPSWWNAWRKPHVCPQCNLRCKSKTGLGRHRAAERRAKEAAAQQPALPLPPPEGSQVMSGAEIACVNPFHLRNGRHDRATCYTTRTPPEEK